MYHEHVRRIGVFKLRNIGDVLIATPALRALRAFFPAARITAVVYAGTEAMLAGNPDVDEILVYQLGCKTWGWPRRWLYELHFLGRLIVRRFDLTIGFNVSERIAWYSLVLGVLGTRWRIGWFSYRWKKKSDLRWRAYTHTPPEHYDGVHEVEKHRLLLQAGGLSAPSGKLRLEIIEPLRLWAEEELASTPSPDRCVVLVHPVSRWLWKCWEPHAMAEVISWLQEERNALVLLTTGPTERERDQARQILSLCRKQPRFYDGNLTLNQLSALIAQADLFLGVDTAPMHIAAAVGTPVVALFGPSNPNAWGPWTEQKRVLSRPCFCGATPHPPCSWATGAVRACLAAIPVEEVKQAVDELLKAHAPAPAQAPAPACL